MGDKKVLTPWEKMADEPFRLFFILGTAHALLAVLFWPLKIYGVAFVGMPSQFHSHLQIYGFMGAFVTGFITTALPRLTATFPLRSWELFSLVLIHLSVVAAVLAGLFPFAALLFAFQIVWLILLLGRRFLMRRRNPPESFIFIPFAFISCIAGNFLIANFHYGFIELAFEYYDLGTALSFQGFILFLLIGIGGFLIRSILGWAPALPSSPAGSVELLPFNRRVLLAHFAAALLLCAGFVIECFIHREAGLLIRAVVVTLETFYSLKIHRRAVSGKLTALTLQISLWMLVCGSWLMVGLPGSYYIGLAHFMFSGTFGIATFAVATRVILSHCGYSALLHQAYRPFTVAMLLLLLGFFARVSADFIPQSYEHHLAYAGVLWVLGILVWSIAVLQKSLRSTLSSGS